MARKKAEEDSLMDDLDQEDIRRARERQEKLDKAAVRVMEFYLKPYCPAMTMSRDVVIKTSEDISREILDLLQISPTDITLFMIDMGYKLLRSNSFPPKMGWGLEVIDPNRYPLLPR